jgi:hypothetical protein
MFDNSKRSFVGMAMPGNVGSYHLKVYMTDEDGKVAYVAFKIKITDVYVPSVKLRGLTEGRTAQVLKRCVGRQCSDEYIVKDIIGEDVVKQAN